MLRTRHKIISIQEKQKQKQETQVTKSPVNNAKQPKETVKGQQWCKEFTVYKTLLIGSQVEYKDPTISLGSNPQKVYDISKVLLAPTDFDGTHF